MNDDDVKPLMTPGFSKRKIAGYDKKGNPIFEDQLKKETDEVEKTDVKKKRM